MNNNLNTISFDNLVSNTDLEIPLDKHNLNKETISQYLNINSLNNIYEYNLVFIKLIRTLKITNISHAYNLRYYLSVIYKHIVSPITYILMVISYLTLFLSNLDVSYKIYGIFLIALIFTPIFIHNLILKNLELNLHNLFFSKLLKPINFILGRRKTTLDKNLENAIKLLHTPEYIHVLALLNNFKTQKPELTNEFGIFNIIDIDSFFHAVSINNESYIKEALLYFSIYLEESKEYVSTVAENVAINQSLISENTNENLNELKTEDTQIKTNMSSMKKSEQRQIYEEKIWFKKQKDILSSIESRIDQNYSPNHNDGFKSSLENLKKLW